MLFSTWKLCLHTISYLKINKYNIRNSFSLLLSLTFFCWCLVYKCPAVVSQQIWIPFATVSLFHGGYILKASIFPGEKIQVRLQEMEFQRHVAPQGTLRFLRSFLIPSTPKVTAYVFKRVPGSIVNSIQFIFEVEVLKALFSSRTNENYFFYLGLAYAWKFFP